MAAVIVSSGRKLSSVHRCPPVHSTGVLSDHRNAARHVHLRGLHAHSHAAALPRPDAALLRGLVPCASGADADAGARPAPPSPTARGAIRRGG